MSSASWPPARLLPTVLIVAGLGFFSIGIVDCLNFTVDDAFIPFRFAENLASGRGLVFNAGERVEGYSNFLWTLLLGALAALGIDQRHGDLRLLIAAKAAALSFALGTMALATWLAVRLRNRLGTSSPGMLSMAVLGLGATYSFALWTMSGMETAMCAFFVTLAGGLTLTALERYDSVGTVAQARFLAAGAVFGIATLIRPEQIYIWGLATAVFMFVAPARLRRMIALAALVTLTIHAIYLLWRWEYYGAFLPNSVVAKWGPGLAFVILGAKYTLVGLIGSVGVMGLGFLALPTVLKRGAVWTYLTVYVGAYIMFVVVSGGDWMPGARFLVPLFPLLWLLCAASLTVLLDRVTPPLSQVWVSGVVLILVLGSFFAGRSLVRARTAFPTGFKRLVWVDTLDRVATGKALRTLLPRGCVLALGECGYIPYFNPDIRIFDLFGLMEPHIARMPGLHMEKLTSAYFMERRPDFYLMMVYESSERAEILPTHQDGKALMASADFRKCYEPWKRFPGFLLFRLSCPPVEGVRSES